MDETSTQIIHTTFTAPATLRFARPFIWKGTRERKNEKKTSALPATVAARQ